MSGEEIHRIRERLGLTQSQAAALLGVHSVTWCRWEKGSLAPSTYHCALLRRFDVAAGTPKCPDCLGVLITSLGPISVLALLLQLSGRWPLGRTRGRGRTR